MTKSRLQERSYDFALRITNLSRYLSGQKHEFVLSKKLLDSGTSIGLCIGEGRQGFDRDDFRLKYSVAIKEAFTTNYLLRDSEYLSEKQTDSMLSDCEELQKMLIATLKTTDRNR